MADAADRADLGQAADPRGLSQHRRDGARHLWRAGRGGAALRQIGGRSRAPRGLAAGRCAAQSEGVVAGGADRLHPRPCQQPSGRGSTSWDRCSPAPTQRAKLAPTLEKTPNADRSTDRSRFSGSLRGRGRRASGRARESAVRQSAGRLRAACPARGSAARGQGSCRRAPPGAPAPGARQRHGQRCEPGRARTLRRRPGDRAQCAWRRRAAGRGLEQRSLRRRDQGRLDVRPRRRGLEKRFLDLRLRPAGAEVAWLPACRHGRAAPDLRRGGGRCDRPQMAAGRGHLEARSRDQRRLRLRHRHGAQWLPASRGRGDRQVGARRTSRDGP